eukprot:s251_g29.t1
MPSNYVNGVFTQDPWASWSGPKPSATSASATPAAPPGAVGPTEQKFAQQEDRLSKLETAMKELQTGATQQTDALQKMQIDSKKRDADIRAHLDVRLGVIKQELDSSLANALKQQSQQFASNFDELKSLLKSKPKRKAAGKGEDDMSEGS